MSIEEEEHNETQTENGEETALNAAIGLLCNKFFRLFFILFACI